MGQHGSQECSRCPWFCNLPLDLWVALMVFSLLLLPNCHCILVLCTGWGIDFFRNIEKENYNLSVTCIMSTILGPIPKVSVPPAYGSSPYLFNNSFLSLNVATPIMSKELKYSYYAKCQKIANLSLYYLDLYFMISTRFKKDEVISLLLKFSISALKPMCSPGTYPDLKMSFKIFCDQVWEMLIEV